MKKVLCYVAIVVLVVLIILPPALRVFVKNDKEEEKPKDVLELLTCTRGDESINMPYQNGNLTSVKYSFMEIEGASGNNEILIGVLASIPNIQIDVFEGQVTYRLDMTVQDNVLQLPDEYRGTSTIMSDYYTNQGYSCDIIQS